MGLVLQSGHYFHECYANLMLDAWLLGSKQSIPRIKDTSSSDNSSSMTTRQVDSFCTKENWILLPKNEHAFPCGLSRLLRGLALRVWIGVNAAPKCVCWFEDVNKKWEGLSLRASQLRVQERLLPILREPRLQRVHSNDVHLRLSTKVYAARSGEVLRRTRQPAFWHSWSTIMRDTTLSSSSGTIVG